MTQWYFWGDKQFANIYENIYIRTSVEDWFKIILSILKEIHGKDIVDIGCGEGHTTKQILDRIKEDYVCDLVEPNKNALDSANIFLKFENNIRDSYEDTLASFEPKKKYDIIFTSHTNYYWASDEDEFKNQLKKAVSLIKKDGKLLILTLPKNSDHYNIMLKQVYPKFNYSEYIVDFYKKKGFKVKIKRFKMRMFVGDILTNDHFFDLNNFYRFIHNTNIYPSREESHAFRDNIRKFSKKGYLDFKDELLIISNR